MAATTRGHDLSHDRPDHNRSVYGLAALSCSSRSAKTPLRRSGAHRRSRPGADPGRTHGRPPPRRRLLKRRDDHPRGSNGIPTSTMVARSRDDLPPALVSTASLQAEAVRGSDHVHAVHPVARVDAVDHFLRGVRHKFPTVERRFDHSRLPGSQPHSGLARGVRQRVWEHWVPYRGRSGGSGRGICY